MLPPGYREVLVTDTRTAQQWETTFGKLRLDVEVVETTGDDVKRGEWQVGASERDAERALALIDAVAQGRARLPGGPVLRSSVFRMLATVAVILGLVVGTMLLVWAGGKP